MKLTKAATTAVCFFVICAVPAIGSTTTNSSSSPSANCTWSPDKLRSDTTNYKINVFGQYAYTNCTDVITRAKSTAQLSLYASVVCNGGKNSTSLAISDSNSCANWVNKGVQAAFPDLTIDSDLCGCSYRKNVTTSCTVYNGLWIDTLLYITMPFDDSQAARARNQIYHDFFNDTSLMDANSTDIGWQGFELGKPCNLTVLHFATNPVMDLQAHSRKLENAWPGLEFGCLEKNETLLVNVTNLKPR